VLEEDPRKLGHRVLLGTEEVIPLLEVNTSATIQNNKVIAHSCAVLIHILATTFSDIFALTPSSLKTSRDSSFVARDVQHFFRLATFCIGEGSLRISDNAMIALKFGLAMGD